MNEGARRPPAPLAWPALGITAGVVLDAWNGAGAVPYLFGIALAGGLLAWPFGRRECGRVIVLLLAVCLGGLAHDHYYRRLPSDHIFAHTTATPSLARITGTIASAPQLAARPDNLFAPWWHGEGRTTFLLDADGIELGGESVTTRGTVRVAVKQPVLDLAIGDHVELFGWCYRPQSAANPGGFDWATHLQRSGVLVCLTCETRECIKRFERRRGVRAAWERVRHRARNMLLDDMLATGGPETTLLDTMILGRRQAIDPNLNEAFIRIGCAHYLAVSGMHVGMLGLFGWWVSRLLGTSTRGGAIVVIAITVLYALIADPRPPIVRAAVMTTAICAGLLIGRRASFLNGLSLAAIAILVAQPTQLFDPGFQFSFSAVLGIVYLSRPLMALWHRRWPGLVRLPSEPDTEPLFNENARSPIRRAGRRATVWFLWTCAAASAAWIVCTPLAFVHFDRVSLWGWLTSPLLFLLVFPIMVLGFAKLSVALIWPTAASLLTTPLAWLASALIGMVELLEHLPQIAIPPRAAPGWLLGVYYLAVFAWGGRHRWKYGRQATWALASVLALCVAVSLVPCGGDGRLTMTVLAVGRGTSIVLELPDGRTWLCDAGASGAYDPGRCVIVPFLRHRGVGRLDGVFLSHPNLDHFGGLPTVIDRVPTGTVYTTPYFVPLSSPHTPSRALLGYLEGRTHPIKILDATCPKLDFGKVSFEILWPPPDLGDGAVINETSLVIRVRYAGRSILLPGDIEAMAQGRLLVDADLNADVLVMPHHGSVRHNSAELIEAADPAVLISSTFVRDAERSGDFVRVIAGRRHLSTADHGAISVIVNSDGAVEVRTHLAATTVSEHP